MVVSSASSGLGSSNFGKNWIKIGGVGEGIFFEKEVKTRPGGFWGGRYIGSARIGSGWANVDGGAQSFVEDDKPIMIWAGEKGLAIMRLKRYFENQKGVEALQRARKVNDQIWNKGQVENNGVVWKDEGKDYFCNERNNIWRDYLNKNSAVGIGYIKKKDVAGPGILSLVENAGGNKLKLVQTVMTTSCRGTEIIYVEKISLLQENKAIEEIDCTQAKVEGKLLKLGKVSAVLYGKNKDLRITEKGIEDGHGNRIKWGTSFLPKLKLELAEN